MAEVWHPHESDSAGGTSPDADHHGQDTARRGRVAGLFVWVIFEGHG